MKSRWLLGILVFLAISPVVVFARSNVPNTAVWNPTILAGPLTVCSGFYMGNGTTGGTPAGNYNGAAFPAIPPCQDLCDLVAQIIQILYFMIGVGIWILIPVLFAWGGVMIMIARGNPTKASEARKILTGAVWGVVIMLCAWVIVSTFVTFFKLTGIGGFDKGGNCMVANPCGNPCPNGESCVWNGSAYGCGQ